MAFTYLRLESRAAGSVIEAEQVPNHGLKFKLKTHGLADARSQSDPSRNASFHFLAPGFEEVSEGGRPS